MMQLRAGDPLQAVAAREQLGGRQHAQRRSGEVDPEARKIAAASADPNVRAGFMLMPDKRCLERDVGPHQQAGADAGEARKPAAWFDTVSTVNISTNEMALSAMNAIALPDDPGSVVT